MTFQNMTDGLFLNALPVLCSRQVFSERKIKNFKFSSICLPSPPLTWTPRRTYVGPVLGRVFEGVLGGVLGVPWVVLEASWGVVGASFEGLGGVLEGY